MLNSDCQWGPGLAPKPPSGKFLFIVFSHVNFQHRISLLHLLELQLIITKVQKHHIFQVGIFFEVIPKNQ